MNAAPKLNCLKEIWETFSNCYRRMEMKIYRNFYTEPINDIIITNHKKKQEKTASVQSATMADSS